MSHRLGVRFDRPDRALPPSAVMGAFPATPGLYLHVPFCPAVCPFCPYNKVRYRRDLVGRYIAALTAETERYLAAGRGPFPSLYVGGGTPTLCLDELEPLLRRLPVDGERAIEVLPSHMTAPRIRRLLDLGFDSVSVGVQSFDERVLHRLGRPGSPPANRAAVQRAVGTFSCVDVDLIFDAGYDDPAILLADLEECFALGVDQVSTYPLMRFGYTPFGAAPHDARREHRVLRSATELAARRGYERRSVWTFNRPGSPSYTSITRPYYLGLGAGAASFAGRVFTVNHFGLEQYCAAVECGGLPLARTAHLSPPAAAAFRAFWQAYTGRMGEGDPVLPRRVIDVLGGAARLAGWARRDDRGWALTSAGYDRYHDLERWVTYRLIEPLWAELMTEHESAPQGLSPEGSR